MLQVVEQHEILGIQVPKHFLPKLARIIQSGILNTKGDKVEIHFDTNGNIRKIYGPRLVDEIK